MYGEEFSDTVPIILLLPVVNICLQMKVWQQRCNSSIRKSLLYSYSFRKCDYC